MNAIAVGRPGTGNSHLTAALGHELIPHGESVLWTATAKPVQRLPQALAQLDRLACLILDDIGYVQHDRDEQAGSMKSR